MQKLSVRHLILTSAATAALILGPAATMAQAPGGERGAGAGAAPGGPASGARGAEGAGSPRESSQGGERGGAAGERAQPGSQRGEAGQGQRGERAEPGAGKGERAEPGAGKGAPASERGATGAEKGNADRAGERGRDAGKADNGRAGEGREGAGSRDAGRGEGPRGENGARGAGHAQITSEQRTRFRSTIRAQHVEAIHSPGFALRAGTIVPERYHFYPLPPALVEIVPEYRGYDYILVDDEIIILEPGTRRIVDVIED